MKCNHSHELTDTIDTSYTDDGSLQESLVQTLDISQRRRYQEHSRIWLDIQGCSKINQKKS